MQLWLKICLCICAGAGNGLLFADDSATPSRDDAAGRGDSGQHHSRSGNFVLGDSPEGNLKTTAAPGDFGSESVAEFSADSVAERRGVREADVQQIPSNVLIELGQHPFGQPLHTTVRLTNRMDTKLTLRTIDPDCGCLNVDPDRREVEPGEALTLTVSLAPAKKLARLRRAIRMLFFESSYPLVVSLDVRIRGPLGLKSSRIDIDSSSDRFQIHGLKRELGVVLERWESARGAFEAFGEMTQTDSHFEISARPTFSFGNASDILRLTYRDRKDELHVVDLPVEFYLFSQIRFLPSTVHVTRQEGVWVGRTRMVMSPRPTPLDMKGVKFVAMTKSEEAFDASRLTVAVTSVSSVLSLVTFTIDAEDESQRPLELSAEQMKFDPSLQGPKPLVASPVGSQSNGTSTTVFPECLVIRDAANNTLGTLFLSRTED